MLKIGLIGSGFIGKIHASAYQKFERVKLVAVADLNETAGRKIADEFGCKYYQRAEEMLVNEEIDVIDICLPTFLHEQYVALAAQHRKHILCEKPFALSVESCLLMQQMCENAGVKLMVAQVVRWVPEFLAIKKLIDQGAFGKLRMVNGKRLSQLPAWTTWHSDPQKSGGCLYDLHVHNIDFLCSVFGKVKSVYATGWMSETGCWDHVVTNLTFESGVVCVDEGSFGMVGDYPFSVSLRVIGDNGTVEYNSSAGKNIEKCETAVNSFVLYGKDQEVKRLNTTDTDAYEAELLAFTNALLDDKPVPIPPSETVCVMKVVEAIQKSLETGEVVYL